jgi:hypothetical protein
MHALIVYLGTVDNGNDTATLSFGFRARVPSGYEIPLPGYASIVPSPRAEDLLALRSGKLVEKRATRTLPMPLPRRDAIREYVEAAQGAYQREVHALEPPTLTVGYWWDGERWREP